MENREKHGDKIKEYYQRQDSVSKSIMVLYDDGIPTSDSRYYQYTEKDIEECLDIIAKELDKNGFKTINIQDFILKIKSIWGITLQDSINIITEHKKFFTYISQNDYKEYWLYDKQDGGGGTIENAEYIAGMSFSKIQCFFLPTNQYQHVFTIKNDSIIVNPNIIHQNKYLFNDSRASLTWLMNDDAIFLENLVDNYGYMQDEKLLKWLLDKRCILEANCDDLEDRIRKFGYLFTHRTCDGKLVFHQEVLDMLGEQPEEKYLLQISFFLSAMLTEYSDFDFTKNYFSDNELTFEERIEVYARILYWGESIIEKNKTEEGTDNYWFYSGFGDSFMVRFHEYLSNSEKDKYETEFKRQNYYSLPKFNEYWEKAKERKRIIDMEYPEIP